MSFRAHLLAGFGLLLSLCGCQPAATPNPPRQIRVVGYGSVTAYPDYAELTVDVSFTKPRLRDAATEVQQAVDQVLTLSKRYAPKPDQVRVSSTSSEKDYDYVNGKEVFRGYQATQSVTVRLNDLRRLGPYMEELLATRARRVKSTNYGHTQADSLHREANALALRDALKTADKMCANLQVRRGAILAVSDELGLGGPHGNIDGWGGSSNNLEVYGKAMGGPGFKLMPELLHFSSTCSITAELK